MTKWIGSFLMTLLGLGLMVYTSIRIVHFVQLTLAPEDAILAYFALFATEFGAVIWLIALKYGSHGGAQRGISLLMIGADIIGLISMFTADTIVSTGTTGLTVELSQNEMKTFVLVLSGLIGLNVIAAFGFHIVDPASKRKASLDEAEANIEQAAMKMVDSESEKLASTLAPGIAQHYMDIFKARYKYTPDSPTLGEKPTPAPAPAIKLPPPTPTTEIVPAEDVLLQEIREIKVIEDNYKKNGTGKAVQETPPFFQGGDSPIQTDPKDL